MEDSTSVEQRLKIQKQLTDKYEQKEPLFEESDPDIEKITKDKLYQSALDLYNLKDVLEKHLSVRTNELFDLQDKIILYDLTNTYFEGQQRTSKLARFGIVAGRKKSG